MEYYKHFKPEILPDCKTGILINDNGTYYVEQTEIINNRGLHHDQVYIQNEEVVGIKERHKIHLVGILYLNNNVKYGFNKKNVPYYKFSPISQKYPDFIVPSKHKKKEKLYCVISLNKWEVNNKCPVGQIENIIGPIGILPNEIDMLLYRTNIYPRKKNIEYCKLPTIDQKPEYHTFSIDPIGCEDIDDALHFKKLSDGFEVGIHIANVARYIKNLNTNKVEITSQNHGFVVLENNFPTSLQITHKSLFDKTIDGMKSKDQPLFSVQYHPESSPGPHDSRYLFDEFINLMDKNAS